MKAPPKAYYDGKAAEKVIKAMQVIPVPENFTMRMGSGVLKYVYLQQGDTISLTRLGRVKDYRIVKRSLGCGVYEVTLKEIVEVVD